MEKTRILIVEDERIVALHLKRQLAKLGYEVVGSAASGERAVALIEEHRPDLVLMDIHLEGTTDGIDVATALPEESDVSIVYLTAYADEETLVRARSTRPYGYLMKPFTDRELHATLQMAIERRRADRALRENEQQLERLVAVRTAELERETAERMKAEQAFRQAQKMEAVGQLTGGIAHDFNNLLTVVIGSLDLMRERAAQSDQVIALVDSASEAVERCIRLIKQLLMFARRQIMRPEIVDLNRLLGEIDRLMGRVTGANVELVLKLDPALAPCRVDPVQFEAAILNLLMNSREAISGQGRITIETRECLVSVDTDRGLAAGAYNLVSVSDTGRGIPPDLLDRVFDPFFTTKEIGEGSGLGLSQIYGFVGESGGRVAIYSEVGVGTTVRLYLPRLAQPEAVAEAPPQAIAPPVRGAGEMVLVVEDESAVRIMVAECLTGLGYQVMSAPDATAALAILGEEPRVDILLSDVVMPGPMNGVQLVAEARRLRPNLKILLTSGYTRSILQTQHGLHEDIALLEKPFRKQELASRVRSMARPALQ